MEHILNWIGELWDNFNSPLTTWQHDNARYFNRIEKAINTDNGDLIPALNRAFVSADPIMFSDGSFKEACYNDGIAVEWDPDLNCLQVVADRPACNKTANCRGDCDNCICRNCSSRCVACLMW